MRGAMTLVAAATALLSATMVQSAGAQGLPASPVARDAQAAPEIIPDIPIVGLAAVTLKVSDLEKSRHYYSDVLGFPLAFELKDKTGRVHSAFFKVNDEQYLELVPGLKPDELVRQARLVVQSSDVAKLHRIYSDRGLKPAPIRTGADGNPVFRMVAPNGFPLDFIQYASRGRQATLMGKLLSPTRISTHLLHAGTMVKDEETKIFFQKLGWGRMLPGTRGDYIETPSTDRNLETKAPPLDPLNPATLPQYTRELNGAVYHFALEIADMHAAREELKRRGGYDDVRMRAAVGNNRRWLIHLFDPDGTRTELMSKDTVPDDVPSFSVMRPGPIAPPILATQKGVYPWP